MTELLDELPSSYETPEDLFDEAGPLKQLKKALLERALGAERAFGLGKRRSGRARDRSGGGHAALDTNAMQWTLHEIATQVTPGARAIVLLDQAGCRTTNKPDVPANITLLPLPPRSPGLNPVENV